MMGHRLVFQSGQFDLITAHLLQDDEEQAAFLCADFRIEDGSLTFEVTEQYLAEPTDFDHQGGFHIALADDALARVIKMAWDRGAALVEMHSHPRPGYPAAFSASDLLGFAEVVPHVRWRLKGAPYVALVVAPGSFDALLWHGETGSVASLAEVVTGGDVLAPTGITLRYLKNRA